MRRSSLATSASKARSSRTCSVTVMADGPSFQALRGDDLVGSPKSSRRTNPEPGRCMLRYNAGMSHALKPHPDSPPCPATRIDVDVARPRAGSLPLTYAVSGRIGDSLLPAVTAAARANLLWQHTCLEAFIGRPGGPYYEFNLSPSTQWQAARFAGYRSGKEIAVAITAAPIETRLGPERYTLQATL